MLEEKKQRERIEDLYNTPRFPEAIDWWASFFARSKEEVAYSNWRHTNKYRQNLENQLWEKYISSGSSILDIGCGKGFFLKRIAENFENKLYYVGLDISVNATKQAKKYFNKAEYVVSTGEELPFKNQAFDYVQIISTLEHVFSPQKVIAEAVRVLKDNGLIYIVLHKDSLDPLLMSDGYRIIKKIIGLRKTDNDPLAQPLEKVIRETERALKKHQLKLLSKGNLVSHIPIKFYLKLKIPIKILLGIGEIVNYIPTAIFKNLEYRIYQK